jgi:hypothetical protein
MWQCSTITRSGDPWDLCPPGIRAGLLMHLEPSASREMIYAFCIHIYATTQVGDAVGGLEIVENVFGSRRRRVFSRIHTSSL